MLFLFQFFMVLTLVLYTATFAVYLSFFLTGGDKSARLTSPLLLGTIFAHLACLTSIFLIRGHLPLTNRGEALTSIVFFLTVIYYYVELRTGEKNLGAFVLALALVFQNISTLFIHQMLPISPLLERGGFVFHALFNMISYSGFFLAFVSSSLYLMLRRQIKRHNVGHIFRRLPSLGILDTMSFHSIFLAFVTFTIGLLAGAIWGKEVWGVYVKLEPKFILAGISWLVYGGYLLLRLWPGWSAKNSAFLASAAFLFLTISFFFSPSVSPSHHF